MNGADSDHITPAKSGTNAPAAEPPAIEVRGLVKRFGTTTALDGLDLTVHCGEVHGFLGPNGAGKSTTIRVLLGLLRQTAGSARLLGGDPFCDAVELHHRLAYVPGDVALWPRLTGGETIDLLTRMRGNPNRARIDELISEFELDPTKKVRTYSKGNRQKVGLIAALSADVELFILDEPTSGLDPLMEATFQRKVRGLRDAGKTVLLSSHILGEVEALCDRVSIIRSGRNVETGRLSEMRHVRQTNVDVTTRKPLSPDALTGVQGLEVDGLRYRFLVPNEYLDATVAVLSSHGVDSLTCTPPTLEELFLRHYESPSARASQPTSPPEPDTP